MTDTSAAGWVSRTHRPMGFPEFVLMVAIIMALNPLAMDVALPALPDIAHTYGITDINKVQSVLSVFLFGFGFGQLFTGPLSDRFGRRPVLMAGIILYSAAGVLALLAPSLDMLLLARLLQGLGTSATRVIATSIVRDCYSGRRMASVVSLAMMIFMAVPILAPSFGQLILLATEWHGLFVALLVYGVLLLLWTQWRLPETLPPEGRKSLAPRELFAAFRKVVTTPQTIGYALAAGGVQGVLFAYVFCSQQIFDQIYHLGRLYPLAFSAVAFGIALAGFINMRLVVRLGMRVISHGALLALLVVSGVLLLMTSFWQVPLWLFMLLSCATTLAFGLMMANFTALAMEPQGDIAGTASSFYGFVTTLLAVGIGYVIGQDFDGTLRPFAYGAFFCTLATLAVVLVIERGRLFVPHNRT